jgi:hypothetical protein
MQTEPFIPSTWVGDCRVNINSTGMITIILYSMILFSLGLFSTWAPNVLSAACILIRYLFIIISGDNKVSNFSNKISKRIFGDLGTKVGFSLLGFIFFVYGLGLPIIVLIFNVYSWESIQRWQTTATRLCAEAQRIELPNGWISPWYPLTPLPPPPIPPAPF